VGDFRSGAVLFMFSCVPYVAVSWLYMKLANGGWNEFWSAFGVLVAVRVFFSIIETLGSVLTWRLYQRGRAAERTVEFLRRHGFPKRKYSHDDSAAYLLRIIDDDSVGLPIRLEAKRLWSSLEILEEVGMLPGMRAHSAMDAALDIYSPRSEAPVFGYD